MKLNSTLIRSQAKQFGPRLFTEGGIEYRITVDVRHDDECDNGHNTFAVTGTIEIRAGNRWKFDNGGCIHEEIAKHFPELAGCLKWHLTSTDGPLHYVANSLYWAERRHLPNFRSCAVWPEAMESDMLEADRDSLNARLGELLAEFRRAVEGLGFTY